MNIEDWVSKPAKDVIYYKLQKNSNTPLIINSNKS